MGARSAQGDRYLPRAGGNVGVPAPFWKVLNLSCSLLPLGPVPITLTLALAHATEGKPPDLAVRSPRVSPGSPPPWQHCPVAQPDWLGPVGSETCCHLSTEGWEEGEGQRAQVSGPLSGFHVSSRVLVSYRGFWAITPELQSVPAGPLLHPPLAAHYGMPASLHGRSAPGTLSVPAA